MSDIETQDKQWDRDNKRGGRDQRDHDKARPKKPDHGDNRDHKGKEAIPRNNTEERSKGSRKRTEEQGKSSKHHTEERGKSSRSYTEDTKGSRNREEEHDESSRRHTEERGNWFEDDQYDDPNAPGPSRRGNWFEGSHYEETPEQSLDTGDGYQDTEVEDLIEPMQTLKMRNDNRNKDPRVPRKTPESFIHWEEWILLDNGQWYP
ncbi:hypothetical protein E8E14_014307 [Neopestalotiopsis sp. 37M]|nr:hypothetical protein E8E14_014307 [Neopestalotiopsis sp. 37M]